MSPRDGLDELDYEGLTPFEKAAGSRAQAVVEAEQPTDFRHVGLHRTAGYILGVDPTEEPPRLVLPDETRPIPEPYVCIAVQSSSQCKHWNNPDGWRGVVSYFKAAGYRVILIST